MIESEATTEKSENQNVLLQSILSIVIFTDTFQKLSFFQADGFFFDTSVGKKKKKIKN